MKAEIRQRMRRRREGLTAAEKAASAERLRANAAAAPFLRDVRRVMCYCAHAGEIDTMPLLRALLARGVEVSVPVASGDAMMKPHLLRSCEGLVPGRYGILTPARLEPAETPELSLCPGCAFSPRGARVGMGQGYYDRFLAAHPSVVAVGLAYDFQVLDELPVEPWDRPMRYVVTDARAIDCGA